MWSHLNFLLPLTLIVGAGCGPDSDDVHDHDHDHDHSLEVPEGDEHSEAGHEGHHHVAPHGGSLLEIGEGVALVEFVLDPQVGELTAYCLDGCAEQSIVLTTGSLPLVLRIEENTVEVSLEGVASALTGETRTNTSEFAVTLPELKGRTHLEVTMGPVEIRGTPAQGLSVTITVAEGRGGSTQ